MHQPDTHPLKFDNDCRVMKGHWLRVGMKTLSSPKQCLKSHLLFEDHNKTKKKLLLVKILVKE